VGVDAVEAGGDLGGTFHLDAPERRGGVGWGGTDRLQAFGFGLPEVRPS
jgi:hypothetical protein